MNSTKNIQIKSLNWTLITLLSQQSTRRKQIQSAVRQREMFMPAPPISTVTTTALKVPTLTIYEDFDKIIAKEVCFTETG